MALLDVTELLSDPYFADTITVTRIAQTVGSDGRAARTETAQAVTAVVQPASARQLEVIPESERTVDSIAIYTTFLLRMAVPGGDPDEVTWNGKTYRVANVKDYSNWGAGFVEAIALAIPPA